MTFLLFQDDELSEALRKLQAATQAQEVCNASDEAILII